MFRTCRLNTKKKKKEENEAVEQIKVHSKTFKVKKKKVKNRNTRQQSENVHHSVLLNGKKLITHQRKEER